MHLSNKYKRKTSKYKEKKVITKIVQLHCNFVQKEPFNLIFHLQLSQFRLNEKWT